MLWKCSGSDSAENLKKPDHAETWPGLERDLPLQTTYRQGAGLAIEQPFGTVEAPARRDTENRVHRRIETWRSISRRFNTTRRKQGLSPPKTRR